MTRAIVDTGPLVSIIRASQATHLDCVAALKLLRLPLLTCLPVVTEATYLLRSRPEEVDALLSAVDGDFLELAPSIGETSR